MRLKVISNGQAAGDSGPWRLFIEIRPGSTLPALTIYGRIGAASWLNPLSLGDDRVQSRRGDGSVRSWEPEP